MLPASVFEDPNLLGSLFFYVTSLVFEMLIFIFKESETCPSTDNV